MLEMRWVREGFAVPIGTVHSHLNAARAKLASELLDTTARLSEPDAHQQREQPLHCPPALPQIHFHDGHTTQQIVSHYAVRLLRLPDGRLP